MGNARDPSEGRETPWIDLARQLAGNKDVAALGSAAATTPPGTEAINRVFAAAEAPVLLLFDEMLNFVNQHRDRAESFHTFIQNLTVAITGTAGAAVISPSFSTPHYPAESRRRPPRPRPVRAARLNVGPIRAQIRLDSAFPERYLRPKGRFSAPSLPQSRTWRHGAQDEIGRFRPQQQ